MSHPTKVTQTEPEVFARLSKSGRYLIEYHRDRCIGAVSCSAIAPLDFAMDDENKAVLLENDDTELTEDQLKERDELILSAAQSCPVFAIFIKDVVTGEQLFPIE